MARNYAECYGMGIFIRKKGKVLNSYVISAPLCYNECWNIALANWKLKTCDSTEKHWEYRGLSMRITRFFLRRKLDEDILSPRKLKYLWYILVRLGLWKFNHPGSLKYGGQWNCVKGWLRQQRLMIMSCKWQDVVESHDRLHPTYDT